MQKSILSFVIFFIFIVPISAQKAKLTPDFHKSKRDALRSKMPTNSVAILFTNPLRNRANDVDYVYHPDPNFYYLTGFKEPQSVLVIFKNPQKDDQGFYYDQLFIQERNVRAEQWNGYRLGLEGSKALGIDRISLRSEFVNNPLDFTSFDEVLIIEFNNDA